MHFLGLVYYKCVNIYCLIKSIYEEFNTKCDIFICFNHVLG